MPRITRIAGSFAIVMIAYWVYALAVVPWIEPAADPRHDVAITERNRRDVARLAEIRRDELKGLFPRGAWELENPKILESDHVKLLFQEYRNFPDGRLEIHPCTMVFPYDGSVDEAERRRRSIILEAPAGAVLQFDQPLDLNRFKMGKLIHGQLQKEVRIRSDWKDPGPEDDLLIETHDIQLTEQTISTPNPVDFRWGPHAGRGREMTIQLLRGPSKSEAGLNVAGVKSFELRHVEQLRIDLGEANVGWAQPTTGGKVGDAHPTSSTPVEIHCQGPFFFDVKGHVATFRDRVDVRKANPDGRPADQLACDVLALHFAERSKTGATSSAASLDLEPERIEAQGKPVVITAPSRELVARAERVCYQLKTNASALDGGQEVFLQQGPNEIHARSLDYQPTDTGQLGLLHSEGPGKLVGQSPDRPEEQLEALWNEQLCIDRDGHEPRISLTGGAELRLPNIAQMQSQKIVLWLTESQQTTGDRRYDYAPARMRALGSVRMNSEQLACRVEDLQVWFEGGGRETGDGGRETFSGPRNDGPAAGQESAQSPGTAVPEGGRVEVDGRLLTAKILLGGSDPVVADLAIHDGVYFRETQTSQPDQPPLKILGDLLVAKNLSEPNATVAVTGKPAKFEGRGLGLSGANINLDRGAKRLWIDGPGQMNLQSMAGNPQNPSPITSGTLTIDWRAGMTFDGQVAHFQEGVVASGRQLQVETNVLDTELRTPKMEVHLQRPVDFSQNDSTDPPKVRTILCSGGVTIDNRTFDLQRRLRSHDRMQVTDLGVDLFSGEMTGGAGRIDSVYRGSPESAEAAAVAETSLLNGLRLEFQKSLQGNIYRRSLTFSDQVRLTHAPVDHWDAVLATADPDRLGPDGVVAGCDRLSLVSMLLPIGRDRSVELEAVGNAVVETSTYTARAYRITYDQAKELLILQGDGRSDATLFQQPQPGAAANTAAAQEIQYWRKTKQVRVIGARSFQFGRPPGGNLK